MKYLVATHGTFSKGIIDSLKLIAGEDIEIDCFSMTKEKSSDDAEAETIAYLEQNQDQTLIVLTDVFGGSVANLFTNHLLNGYEFQLITGVNLPMLLSLILSEETAELSVEDWVLSGIEEGKKGILQINQLIKQQGGQNNDDIFSED
ncbi:PTS sugar transporter subunit IIA [Enterococcus gallinarum]|uniref:PTS sugar transporter subunit IIA n=1 Tax=Enterococcus gallinarum TaxID=1353 RepID=UPI0012E22CA6|nr:PTS mannose transporter subunit IIA [Enterococcus gallinarum]MUO31894.1 PTS mannose transporter subunit IIA [Enterococcus gallinarum]